jgi:hypothetical protein
VGGSTGGRPRGGAGGCEASLVAGTEAGGLGRRSRAAQVGGGGRGSEGGLGGTELGLGRGYGMGGRQEGGGRRLEMRVGR